MNWKNSLLFVCFYCSFSSVLASTSQNYQTYQRLQMQLQQDALHTLPALYLFEKQVQRDDIKAKKMSYHLLIQACISLQRYACASHYVDIMLGIIEPSQNKTQLLRLATQLHYQIQEYSMVIDKAQQWLTSLNALKNRPSHTLVADIYTLKSYSYYYQLNFDKALLAIKNAIKNKATEGRYLFLLNIHKKRKDKVESHQVLKYLVSHYPNKKQYWEQYSQSFLQLKQEKKALDTLGSAYKAKRLSEHNILLYTLLLLKNNAPNRAVIILEENPNLEKKKEYQQLLTQAYLNSRDTDKAALWLEKYSENDKISTQALLAYQQGKWEKCIQLTKRLDKHHSNRDYWSLLQAMSYFELQRWEQSQKIFTQLLETPYKNVSKSWIKQILYLTQ
ncbi:tPR domain protein component of TonB system [Psychromonas sp. CNPT3]|uniref:tetratricopeptide repeat protein n=1 Tax=Psychromonas sp. CNPT3 TaxID=314282 RepID=UPI00006E9E54|nr:tPR domain protein component of TonB system [Psychromonas sp. CNPT3]AGH82352.1 tPR domain protein component of TonB system [Psychromonas sp. CNPT3]